MMANNLILIVAMLCVRVDCVSSTPIDDVMRDDIVGGQNVDVKDMDENRSDGAEAKVEMFDTLRGLIEESRDAIIGHIDETIDNLRRDIILNDDNEFVIADDAFEAVAEKGTDNVCYLAGGEPVCGEFGECVTSHNGEPKCLCEHGYTGDTCQLVDHCAEITCLHDGECVNNREGFECDCSDGWYGEHCELNVE